jgi:hypothetical protein
MALFERYLMDDSERFFVNRLEALAGALRFSPDIS